MEWDKKDLERQLNELKLKSEQAERAAVEQRQVDEKKHAEEIQFLKRTNQQLKVGTSLRKYFIAKYSPILDYTELIPVSWQSACR